MSQISRQGIYVDCKQLIDLTYELINHLSNKDRILVGDKLMTANVDMSQAFAMAYTRADEKLTYDDGVEFFYEVAIKGCKRNEIDRLAACFEHYKTLWEFAFGKLELQRWSTEQKRAKKAQFVMLLAKIETGIQKWRQGTPRQVVVSRKRHNPDQTL